jgi:hypothetical protein
MTSIVISPAAVKELSIPMHNIFLHGAGGIAFFDQEILDGAVTRRH